MLRCRRIPHRLLLGALGAVFAAAGACATVGVPEVPAGADGLPDPVLVAGRAVYINRCASCHGNDGGGGRGAKLSGGRMIEAYPLIEDQVVVVAAGVLSMPAFADVLGAEEIAAVVRYTREVL